MTTCAGRSPDVASTPGGSADAALLALPVRLAQGPAEQLPDGGLRDLVDDVEAQRLLVGSQPGLPAVLLQLLEGHRLAVGQRDARLDRLAPLLVGHTDDGDLPDRRMAGDDVLDLARVHVQSAADDHVVL